MLFRNSDARRRFTGCALTLAFLLWVGWVAVTHQPTRAEQLAGGWLLVAGENVPARLSVVRTSDDGGTYVGTRQDDQMIVRGTWTIKDDQLTVIVTDAPWHYCLMLGFSGMSLPMYTELRIQELTKTRLILRSDSNGSPETVTYEYRRP